MSLNLGDVTLGLEADLNALTKAQKALRQFASDVDSLVVRMDKVTRGDATFVRQEKAIRAAREQLLSFSASVKRVGADSILIANASRSFNALQKAMRAGKLDALDYARAMDRFKASLNNGKRALDDFKNSANNAQQPASKLHLAMQNLVSASVLAAGPLSGLGARIAAFGAITTRATAITAIFYAGVATAVLGLYKLTGAMLQARREMDQIDATFYAATGSIGAANSEIQFLTTTSQRLGVRIRSVAKEYAQFSVAARDAGLTTSEIHDSFIGVATASVALQLSGDETAGVFKALRDSMSKGTIQAEELRGQLGDRLPGAMGLAQLTTGKFGRELDKLLKQGQIISTQFIPEFARVLQQRFAGAAELAGHRMEASLARLDNSWFIFLVTMESVVKASRVAQVGINSLSGTLDFLTGHMEGFVATMGAATIAMITFAAANKVAALIGVSALSRNIIRLTAALLVFVAAWAAIKGSIKEVEKTFEAVVDKMRRDMETPIDDKIAAEMERLNSEIALLDTSATFIEPELIKFAAGLQLTKDGAVQLTDGLLELNTKFKELRARSELKKLVEDSLSPMDKLRAKIASLNKLKADLSLTVKDPGELKRMLAIVEQALDNVPLEPFKNKTEELDSALAVLNKSFKGVEPDLVQFAYSAGLVPEQLEIAADGTATMSDQLQILNGRFKELRIGKELEDLANQVANPMEQITLKLEKLNELRIDAQTIIKDPEKLQKALELIDKAINHMSIDPITKQMQTLQQQMDFLQGKLSESDVAFLNFADSLGILPDEYETLSDGTLVLTDRMKELKQAFQDVQTQTDLKSFWENNRTPMETYQEEQRKLNLLMEQSIEMFNRLGTSGTPYAEESIARINQAMQDLTTTYKLEHTTMGSIVKSIGEAFEDAAVRARSLTDIIADLRQEIERLVIRQAFTQPFEQLLASVLPGINVGPVGSTPTTRAPSPSIRPTPVTIGARLGAAFSGGNIIPFARGGIISKPTLMPLKAGAALMGEAGTEAVMPLRRMAGGSLGVETTGGGYSQPNIIINDYRPAGSPDVDVQTSKRDIILTLKGPVNALVQGGHLDKALRNSYRGMRRRPTGG